MIKKIKSVDLFSGCGGFSLGMERAGVEVVAAFDNWVKAQSVYEKNFKHPFILEDLSNVEEVNKKLKEFDFNLIVGGPPCQDFSSAGFRDETRGRADLTIDFLNIVISAKPRFFIMENVSRILKSEKIEYLKSAFSENGYNLESVVLNASFFNVPQRRKRFFLVGSLEPFKTSFIDEIGKLKEVKEILQRFFRVRILL